MTVRFLSVCNEFTEKELKKWLKVFQGSREGFENDLCLGHYYTSTSEGNVEPIRVCVPKDYRLAVDIWRVVNSQNNRSETPDPKARWGRTFSTGSSLETGLGFTNSMRNWNLKASRRTENKVVDLSFPARQWIEISTLKYWDVSELVWSEFHRIWHKQQVDPSLRQCKCSQVARFVWVFRPKLNYCDRTPDLALCNVFLFPKCKMVLRERHLW